MTRIDIVSGFLGAGKTTLIKKLLKEALNNTKVVLIENEFGEIGIDGGFLKEAGIEIKEMNSGCICCSLVGDFGTSLKEVLTTYAPERILIEPSGVGKLSDVIKAVEAVTMEDVQLNSAVAVVDASKCKMYIKNFGEFFVNQIEHAGTIILSRTDKVSEEKIEKCVELIREHNAHATIVTTPLDQIDGEQLLQTIEGAANLQEELMKEVLREQEHHHDHGEHHHEHHHEHGEECTCGCHDHEEHEHHHHKEECGCGHHDHDEHHHEHHHNHDEHHHEHGEECTCGCHGHGHEHEHHHHADEVFTSWGMETPSNYTQEEIAHILEELEDEKKYGFVLRAKGMLPNSDGTWTYFDYVPGEGDIRTGKPDVTGKICVIGSKLQEENLEKLFEK